MTIPHITQEELKRFLDYDLDTGVFTWKSIGGMNRHQGKSAGTVTKYGYIEIKLLDRCYKAHRLAWLCVYGEIPRVLDHINRNKADNRICNLRPASYAQNRMNSGPSKNNSTGFKGIFKTPGYDKFTAQIRINGKAKYLGDFKTPEEAHAAYLKEAHKVYGEFVPHNHSSVTSLIGEKK